MQDQIYVKKIKDIFIKRLKALDVLEEYIDEVIKFRDIPRNKVFDLISVIIERNKEQKISCKSILYSSFILNSKWYSIADIIDDIKIPKKKIKKINIKIQ